MALRVALAIRSEKKSEPYRRALQAVGLEAVTFGPDAGGSPGTVAGIVLTGGTDVDPALYGAAPAPETDSPDRVRDDYESALLAATLALDLPILAICRGLQLFNVAQGGTLIQHLPATPRHKQRTGGSPVHDVVLEGCMAEIFGAHRMPVNSRHHQAIDTVAPGIVVTARDPEDGVIEGVVFPAARFAIGVQWHPEDMDTDARQMRLFTAFSVACALR